MQKKLAFMGLFVLLILAACDGKTPIDSVPGTVSVNITVTQTSSPVPSATASRTPAPTATKTASSTPTPDPMIVQGNAFALPILEKIATRQPDWEDDFSNPYRGWSAGQLPSQGPGWGGGEAGYLDDAYFVLTLPETHQQIESSFGSRFANMVFEIDTRFADESGGAYEIHFRHQKPPRMGYIVLIDDRGRLSITKYISGDVPSMLMEVNPPSLLRGTATNHIQIVAVRSEIAVFANGELAAYVIDPDYERDSGAGQINIVTANFGSSNQTTFFDNLKLWILPNHP